MTERILPHTSGRDMIFVKNLWCDTLKKRVCSCEICNDLNVEPLLPELRDGSCIGAACPLSNMSQERLARQVLLATHGKIAQRSSKDEVD